MNSFKLSLVLFGVAMLIAISVGLTIWIVDSIIAMGTFRYYHILAGVVNLYLYSLLLTIILGGFD